MGHMLASLPLQRLGHSAQVLLSFALAGHQDPAELQHESPAEQGREAELWVPPPEDCQRAMHLLARQGGPRNLLQKLQGSDQLPCWEPKVQQGPQLAADWFVWLAPCLQLLQVGSQVAP
eukprot:8719959-Alexandrium_andersonii.AAC.1